MGSVSVRISGDLADFVEDRVANGDYGSVDEVVVEAVRMLSEEHSRKLSELRAAIQLGLDDIDEGRVSTRTVKDITADVLRRHRG